MRRRLIDRDGIGPLIEGTISESDAMTRTLMPLHAFMIGNVRGQDLKLFADIAKTDVVAEPKDVPLRILVPAFMISELRRALKIERLSSGGGPGGSGCGFSPPTTSLSSASVKVIACSLFVVRHGRSPVWLKRHRVAS